jgi:hypothetical protein
VKVGDLKIEPMQGGGVRAFGTDPDLSMDDLADAMFEGFLRSEALLRQSGQSHFDKPEGDKMADEHALTFGEKAVGLTFNPSGDETVAALKRTAAAFIDTCHEERTISNDPEIKRMYSIAITEAQTAQMWAVKAATWRA